MSREDASLKPEDLKLTHDGFFQEVFQLKRIAKAFLKKTLPKKALRRLDLEQLTVERRNLVDKTFKRTIADVVYRVPIKGTKKHVDFLVIVEHKSESDYLTIFQLWGYVYLACRRAFLEAGKREEINSGYRLPPLVAIILHHGRSKFRAKTQLSELFVSLPDLEEYYPKLQAILFDLNEIDDDDPVLNDPEVPELKVVLMVMKTVFRQDVALKVKDVLRELKPYSDDPAMRRLIRTIWVYLANNAKHLKKNLQTLLGTFQEVVGGNIMSTMVEIWTAEGEARGKIEGKIEGRIEGEAKGKIKGRIEGEAKGILMVLEVRFKTVPKNISDRVKSIGDLVVLESLAEQAKTCDSLEEFKKSLK